MGFGNYVVSGFCQGINDYTDLKAIKNLCNADWPSISNSVSWQSIYEKSNDPQSGPEITFAKVLGCYTLCGAYATLKYLHARKWKAALISGFCTVSLAIGIASKVSTLFNNTSQDYNSTSSQCPSLPSMNRTLF